MNEKEWLTYLLECSDGSYYCGATNNLEKRIKTHNSGKGAKYTKNRLPVKLLATCSNLTKGEALSLEYKTKQLKKDKKVNFLNKWNEQDEQQ